MNLMRILILIILSVFSISNSYSQRVEGGIFTGVANYQGDLTQSAITLSRTKPSFGLLGRWYFSPRLNIKGNVYYGWIEGNDMDGDKYRINRNMNFKSSILDIGTQVEMNILPFISNSRKYRISPYVFSGISLFHFDRNGTNYNYPLWQGAIPYGVGIKWSMGNYWNLGFEVGQRKLFTDYLDGYSSPETSDDDMYFFTGVTITKTNVNFLKSLKKLNLYVRKRF